MIFKFKGQQVRIGDRITFRAITKYSNARATRKVNGFWGSPSAPKPTVRYKGWPDFPVFSSEIIKHIKQEDYETR